MFSSSPSFSSTTLLPPDRSKEPGKSMPMMDHFTDFSMVGVYETRKELKFVHVKSEKFIGRFTILIFMDDKLSEMEIEEWKDFSDHIKDFKNVGASVVGVCTDSHISMRTMMMSFLRGIKFPIISDRDGDFSRAFGVLKLRNCKFGAARALVILDQEGRMVHMSLHNESTRSYPGKVVELIKHLKKDGEGNEVTVDDSAARENSAGFWSAPSKSGNTDNSRSGSAQSGSNNSEPASKKSFSKDISTKSISVLTKSSNSIKDSNNKGKPVSIENSNNSRMDSSSSNVNPEENKNEDDDKKKANRDFINADAIKSDDKKMGDKETGGNKKSAVANSKKADVTATKVNQQATKNVNEADVIMSDGNKVEDKKTVSDKKPALARADLTPKKVDQPSTKNVQRGKETSNKKIITKAGKGN